MLMIVAGHSIVHGGYNDLLLTGNGLFAIALTQGSRIGVNIFVFYLDIFLLEETHYSRSILF